jgi:hypothetical protein
MNTVDSRLVCYFLVDGSKGLLIVPTNDFPVDGRSLFSEDPAGSRNDKSGSVRNRNDIHVLIDKGINNGVFSFYPDRV